jgi:hypothetical protein
MEHTVTHAEAVEVIKHYTTNIAKAEPELSVAEVNALVAEFFAKYLAAAADPGKYVYYPHPSTQPETILHHAAAHIAAAPVEIVTQVAVTEIPGGLDFAEFSALLGVN